MSTQTSAPTAWVLWAECGMRQGSCLETKARAGRAVRNHDRSDRARRMEETMWVDQTEDDVEAGLECNCWSRRTSRVSRFKRPGVKNARRCQGNSSDMSLLKVAQACEHGCQVNKPFGRRLSCRL